MFDPATPRFEQVQIERTPGQWATLSPRDFERIPLTERIQLIVGRKIKFFSGGAEVSPMEALKD
jgi:hypothetical protein